MCLFVIADDVALLAATRSDAEWGVREYQAVSSEFSLTVRVSKTRHILIGSITINISKTRHMVTGRDR